MSAKRQSIGIRRRALTAKQRKDVRAKTGGRCHLCGVRVGKRWQADHIVPHYRGGESSLDNYLPICRECNRLRWAYKPGTLRKIMRLGVYARKEVKKKTKLGEKIKRLLSRRVRANRRRRKPKDTSTPNRQRRTKI